MDTNTYTFQWQGTANFGAFVGRRKIAIGADSELYIAGINGGWRVMPLDMVFSEVDDDEVFSRLLVELQLPATVEIQTTRDAAAAYVTTHNDAVITGEISCFL